jgi:FolB domain-containing protein
MSKITIADLEIFLRVGVPDEERARPQRVLLTVEMDFDFTSAARTDRINETIDYFAVAQRLLKVGEGRSWKLIEKLAADVADLVLSEFKPQRVTVEVKKFPIPQARHVSVRVSRERKVTGI